MSGSDCYVACDSVENGILVLKFLDGSANRGLSRNDWYVAAQMERMASAAMGKPGMEGLLLANQADTQAWYGKLKNARELTRRAMDSAEHNDAKETAASCQAWAPVSTHWARQIEFGLRVSF
jgi:hypothetical protein